MEVYMRFFYGHFWRVFVLLLSMCVLVSCVKNPAETRAKHMKRGDAYFEKQEFKKAIIEYKNAIQTEPKFARGHYQLALAYMKARQKNPPEQMLKRT